jgi:hypothetical protein
MSEEKKDVIRRYGFGSLLLFDKCFVPKKFSKWLAYYVECKSGDLLIRGKIISLTAKSVNFVLGIPVGGTSFPSNYFNGRSTVLLKIDKSSLPRVFFFVEKLKANDMSDELVLIYFLAVALHCFRCSNSNIVPSPRYLGVFEDIENIRSYDWSGFVLRWLHDGVKNFNGEKKDAQKGSATLGRCMFYLAVSVLYMLCILLFISLFMVISVSFQYLFFPNFKFSICFARSSTLIMLISLIVEYLVLCLGFKFGSRT